MVERIASADPALVQALSDALPNGEYGLDTVLRVLAAVLKGEAT